MNILTEKSVGSTSTTCSSLHSPKFHYNSDNVNYVNLNFVEASETSSQEKRDLLDQQEMQINQDQQQQNQQCKQDQESQEGQQQKAHQMELQQQAPQEEASQQQLPQQQLPQQQAPQQQAPQQQAPQQQAPQQQAPQQQAPQQKATQQKAPQQQSPQQQAPQQQEFQQQECQQHKHQQQTHQHKESHYEDHHEQQPHHEKHHRQGHDSQELQQQKPQKKESEQKELKQQQPQQQEPQKQEPQKPQQYLNRFLIHTNPVSLNIISSLTLVRPKKATVNPNGPKTLKEMGFNVKRCKHWKQITQPLKTDLNTLLRNLIENFIKPSVQVQIGSIHFNCHMMVLQCYSDFFNKYNNKFFIELPEKQVTPAAFMMAYEWMLTDKPIVQREGIIELLKAAKFLCIKDLLNQCWEFLDDDVRIREDVAFLLYMEARHYGDLENLEQLMIPRISKFFLTLVASYNFLQLTIKDIISFLSSNTIGVTSEAEVFMAAVHWLNHNWENREQYVVTVMKTVRFALLPPYLLVILTKGTDCIEIDRVLSHSEVKDMIIDGMTLSSMRLHYKGNCDQMINFLNRHSLLMPMERQWIRETESDTPITSYKSFMDKLQKIQVIGQDYWRSLEFRTNFEQSCTSFNIKKESNI